MTDFKVLRNTAANFTTLSTKAANFTVLQNGGKTDTADIRRATKSDATAPTKGGAFESFKK